MLCWVALFYVLCAVAVAVLFLTAPEGHETADGFRFGPEPDDARERTAAPAPGPVSSHPAGVTDGR